MGGAFFMRESSHRRGRRTFPDPNTARGYNVLSQDGMAPAPDALPQESPSSRTTRFTKGFHRRPAAAINPAAEREAAQAARAARAEAAAEARRQRIVQARDRNGSILAHDDGGAADALRRGRKFIDHQTTQVLQREGKRDMLRGDLRFHAPVASGGHRTTLLKQGGHQATKYSSVLGMGRADTPSHGAADNFQYSQYDPAWAAATHGETPHGAPSSPPSHSGARSPLASAGSAAVDSGDGAARDAFAARLDAKLKDSFAFGGRQREPNRVFDDNVDSARLAPAVPDREAQHKRIMADIDHSRKAAKARAGTAASSARAPRQHSLVAEARLLEASRRRAALDRDIAMVRALK